MIWRRPEHDERRRVVEHLEPSITDELSRPIDAPDLTRSIMGRVGYSRAVDPVVRRRRRQRIFGRMVTTLAAAMAMTAGVVLYQHTTEIRRPQGPTIPAALGHDVQQHRHRVNQMIQTIRDRTEHFAVPVRPQQQQSPPVNVPLEEDVDRSAVGPVEWI